MVFVWLILRNYKCSFIYHNKVHMWLLYSLRKETGKKNPKAVLKFNKQALVEDKMLAIFWKRFP